jgi:hypothetical protein
MPNFLHFLRATVFAAWCGAALTASAAPTIEDKLLPFEDLGFSTADGPKNRITWLSETRFLVSVRARPRNEYDPDLYQYDLTQHKLSLVHPHSFLYCWSAAERRGIAAISTGTGASPEVVSAYEDATGAAYVTALAANKAECSALERGNTVLHALPASEAIKSYFKAPYILPMSVGLLITTGIADPYGTDTFFWPTGGGAPFRVYKHRGMADQIGARSISPSGCGLLWPAGASGIANSILAFGHTSEITLHYVDVCKSFNQPNNN